MERFARGRRARIVLLVAIAMGLHAVEPVFWERDGVIAFEVESAPLSGAWALERAMDGFTGSGYYTWGGANAFNAPGSGVLTYRIRVTTPGTWQLRIRNRHDQPDHTEHNDCFTRIDGGEWVKTFSSKRGEWTWHSRHEFSHGDKPAAGYELSAGEHVFEISGRSNGFSIDRVHLYRAGAVGAEDHTRDETRAGPAMPELDRVPAVARAWRSGALGKALAEAEDSEDAQATTAATTLRAYAEQQRERIEAFKAQAPVDAVTALAELAAAYRGHDLGDDLRDEAKAWSKEPAVRDAAKAAKVYAAMAEAAGRLDRHGSAEDQAWLRRNQRHLKVIIGGLRRLEQRHPEAPATARARALVADHGLDGLR